MIPVPAWWLAAASRTHAPAWRAVATTYNGWTPTGSHEIPIVGGILARSGDSYPRTRLQLETPAAGDPVPPAPDHLRPYGTRITLAYAIDGSEWITVAELHVLRSVVERPAGRWALEAVDASALVAADTVCAMRPGPALHGQTIGQAVALLVRRTLPQASVTVTGAAGSTLVPADYEQTRDPWRTAEDLVALVGATIHVDPAHPWSFRVRPAPELGDPVDTIGPGPAGNVTGYRIFHERTWNAVAVEYKDPDSGAIVSGWWQDDRPGSALNPNVIGHYMTLLRQLDGTATPAGADAAARSIGLREAGYARTNEAQTVPRPWLEPGDTVAMGTLAVPGAAVLVAGIRCPLDHSPMSVDLDNPNYVDSQTDN